MFDDEELLQEQEIEIQSKPNSKHYITKEKLLEEYYKSLEQDACTETLLMYFQKIAKRFSNIYRNQNRTDWNAIINYAVAEAWLKWKTYDPSRTSNIFSFYTTIIANDMRNHYKQINKGKSINISIDALFQNSQEK